MEAMVGGLAVSLKPQDFMQLVTQKRLTTIHGKLKDQHTYWAASGGLTFYTQAKQPLLNFPVDVEAAKIKSFIHYTAALKALDIAWGLPALVGAIIAGGPTGGKSPSEKDAKKSAACLSGCLIGLSPEAFLRLSPKMSYIVQGHRKKEIYTYLGTLDSEITCYTFTDIPLGVTPHFKSEQITWRRLGLKPSVCTVGGLSIGMIPQDFVQLVTQQRLTIIHGQYGTYKPEHVYLTIINGITFYTRTKKALPGIRADIEASSIENSREKVLKPEMVMVGGLLVRLKPQDFIQLVTQQSGYIIYGQHGIVTRWHLYLTVSGGLTFYTKAKKLLPRIHAHAKTPKLYSDIDL